MKLAEMREQYTCVEFNVPIMIIGRLKFSNLPIYSNKGRFVRVEYHIKDCKEPYYIYRDLEAEESPLRRSG